MENIIFMQRALSIILIISIFIFLIIGFFHPISAITQDLGRHFLLGEIILKTHEVPLTNLFSYTYPDFPFINLHWFSEVVFYLIYNLSGYNALLLTAVFIVSVSFALVFFKALKKNNILALSIISILYLRVLFERTDVRPEIFSFLFLSIFITILYSYRDKFTKWIFIFPILELFWVNIHIYFIIGIAVLGLFLIDALISEYKDASKKIRVSDNLKNGHFGFPGFQNFPKILNLKLSYLFLVLLASIFTALLNPNGINGALYPFRVFENYGYTIEENQNVFFLWNLFNKTTILFFFISAATLILSALLTIKKAKLIDIMLICFFTYLAASAERNFPLFVFGTFIAFSKSLSEIQETLFSRIKTLSKLNFLKTVIGIMLLIIIFKQGAEIIQLKKPGFGVEKGAKSAADFFLKNDIKGPLFNNFDIGGYLDYRLYPKEKVFVDNRPGEYPASFFQKIYIPMQFEQKEFEKVSKQYNFNSVFFGHTDQTPWGKVFISRIVNDNVWKIVYLDDFAIILLKNNKQNAKIIEKYKIDQDSFTFDYSKSDMSSLYRFLNFFGLTGWKKNEIKVYQQMLLLEPDSCFALYNLAKGFAEEKPVAAQTYGLKYNLKCR